MSKVTQCKRLHCGWTNGWRW